MECHSTKKRNAPEKRPKPKGKVDSQPPSCRASLSFGGSTTLKCNMESVHKGPGKGDSDRSRKSSWQVPPVQLFGGIFGYLL